MSQNKVVPITRAKRSALKLHVSSGEASLRFRWSDNPTRLGQRHLVQAAHRDRASWLTLLDVDSETTHGGSSRYVYYIGLDVHKKTISYCIKTAGVTI